MKVSKFEEKARNNPWMWTYFTNKRCIYGFKPGETGKRLKRLRDWVATNINYVNFHPFEKLNLNERKSENWEALQGKNGIWHRVEFELIWHANSERPWAPGEINGQNIPFSQIYCHVHGERNFTSAQLLQGLILQHLRNPYAVTGIFFDAIVKRSYRFSTLLQDTTDEKFEIFLVPRGWFPSWMATDSNVQELLRQKQIFIPGLFVPDRMKPKPMTVEEQHSAENYRRYNNGEPLGPIIPGTLKFA